MPVQRPKPVVTQTMIWERLTKHYHNYVASDFGMPVPNIYISRDTWPSGKHPTKVTITVTVEE